MGRIEHEEWGRGEEHKGEQGVGVKRSFVPVQQGGVLNEPLVLCRGPLRGPMRDHVNIFKYCRNRFKQIHVT